MANGAWRIARGKGSGQLSIAVVAVLAVALLVTGRVQSSLFGRVRAYFSDASLPLLEAVHAPADQVSAWLGGLDNLFSLYRENLALKAENARLRQWQNAALILRQRLRRYQLLLNAVPDPSLAVVTAHVVGRSDHPFLNTLILDAGSKSGVKPGEAVIDASGMIGRIYLVGRRTSWVILLTDLNSHIPVTVEPDGVQAMMSGDNTAAPLLDAAGQNAVLKSGQQIISSGDGGLLPAGIEIGTVFRDGRLFRADLFADAGTVADVRILDLKTPPEEPPEPTPANLPVNAAGIPPVAPGTPPAQAAPATDSTVAAPAPAPPSGPKGQDR